VSTVYRIGYIKEHLSDQFFLLSLINILMDPRQTYGIAIRIKANRLPLASYPHPGFILMFQSKFYIKGAFPVFDHLLYGLVRNILVIGMLQGEPGLQLLWELIGTISQHGEPDGRKVHFIGDQVPVPQTQIGSR